MTDTAALPASPDELMPAWLTDALTRGGTLSGGARVIGCAPRRSRG